MMHNPRREGNLGMRGKKGGFAPHKRKPLAPQKLKMESKTTKQKQKSKKKKKKTNAAFPISQSRNNKNKTLATLNSPTQQNSNRNTHTHTHTHTQKILKQNIPKGGIQIAQILDTRQIRLWGSVRFGLLSLA